MAQLNWRLLTAFEAVARHRSFTRAARELNVQQPSISRRVVELEEELGVILLQRTRPKATLTAEGDLLYRALSSSMYQVQSAIQQVRASPSRDHVVVNTTIGFASCYLMHRLAGFRIEHPEVTLELVSRDQNASFGAEHADVVIVFDTPQRLPGIAHTLIFPEELVPIARPDLFKPVGDDMDRLQHLPLLHLTSAMHHDDWQTYLSETGSTVPHPRSDQRYTSFMVYLQAALNGEGIILGWEHLLQTHFDLGQLTRVSTKCLKTERGYYACLTERAERNDAAKTLINWFSTLHKPARVA